MTNPITTLVEMGDFDATKVVHFRNGCDVYIGRSSMWGNPFRLTSEEHRDVVIAKYERWLRGQPDLIRSLPTLAGKRLGCHCAPKACHGDVLIKLLKEKFHAN